jgi:hypothetical protein
VPGLPSKSNVRYAKRRNLQLSTQEFVNFTQINVTARFKNVNNYLNTNIYSYVATSGGQSSSLYLNAVNIFNTIFN